MGSGRPDPVLAFIRIRDVRDLVDSRDGSRTRNRGLRRAVLVQLSFTTVQSIARKRGPETTRPPGSFRSRGSRWVEPGGCYSRETSRLVLGRPCLRSFIPRTHTSAPAIRMTGCVASCVVATKANMRRRDPVYMMSLAGSIDARQAEGGKREEAERIELSRVSPRDGVQSRSPPLGSLPGRADREGLEPPRTHCARPYWFSKPAPRPAGHDPESGDGGSRTHRPVTATRLAGKRGAPMPDSVSKMAGSERLELSEAGFGGQLPPCGLPTEWCSRRDSNSHSEEPAPQAGGSTKFPHDCEECSGRESNPHPEGPASETGVATVTPPEQSGSEENRTPGPVTTTRFPTERASPASAPDPWFRSSPPLSGPCVLAGHEPRRRPIKGGYFEGMSLLAPLSFRSGGDDRSGGPVWSRTTRRSHPFTAGCGPGPPS